MLRARYLLLGAAAAGALAAAGCADAPARGAAAAVPALRVNGSTTVQPAVAAVADLLRAQDGVAITVDVQGGSSGGLAALGDGRADVAMSSREVNATDRKRYPETRFHPVRIGVDAVALVVAKDVWEGGVRALSREQVQAVYEGRVANWRALGGPDRRIVFFSKEPGRGTWEVFAKWLYGDAEKAPLVTHPEVGANEEARTKVASTPGAIAQLSAAWADGETVFALGIVEDGKAVMPTPAAVAGGSYPLVRPLLLVTDGPPRGSAKQLVDLLLAPRGQALVAKHGYLTLDRLAGGEDAAPAP
ncbi:MAG TPA: phosphate ABC transporter substrate-binding protein [Thermoanaerobaculia bacterium]